MATKKMTYKEAFAKLEKILTEIEDAEIDVDLLAEKIRTASELIKFCKSKLTETETEVEKILDEMEKDE